MSTPQGRSGGRIWWRSLSSCGNMGRSLGKLVDDPSPNYKGEHIHPGYWTGGIAMERGGGDHQYLFEGKCLPPQNPEWFPNR